MGETLALLFRIAFLAGLLGVPALLLYLGQRLRGRGIRGKAGFWGGVAGYVLGTAATLSAMLLPPVSWVGGSFLRTLVVHWSILLGGILGIVAGLITHGRRG